MKVFIKCCKSKEKGTLYHTLNVDFGYRVGVLTMDKDVICEMADIKYSQLYGMKAEETMQLGDLLIRPSSK